LGQPLGPVQSDVNNLVPLANLPASVLGSSHYLGTWNALLNEPLIQSSVAPDVTSPVGAYYIVSVSGTPTIDGVSSWPAGAWIIWNGSVWNQISGQVNPVSSVAGLQGAITTPQLSSALAGGTALIASGGLLNVVLGTAANTAAAGNDSRIVNAAQLDVAGHLSYLTVGPNVSAVASFQVLQALAPPSPQTMFNDGQKIRTVDYAVPGDLGAVLFRWNASSTRQPDSGHTACPNFLSTTVTGELAKTGSTTIVTDGTTLTYSGTLAHAVIIPGSVRMSCGSVTATDLGERLLTGTGVVAVSVMPEYNVSGQAPVLAYTQYVSTISLVTGVWSVTFSVAPAAGLNIAFSYAYAGAAGRWIAQEGWYIDIRQFGGLASADIFGPANAADNFATTHGRILYIPTGHDPTSGAITNWGTTQPLIIQSEDVVGDNGTNYKTLIGARYAFTPIDQTSTITFTAGNGWIRNLAVDGADYNIPTLPNLLTSGWVITLASGSGTILGNIFTVSAGFTGTWAVGQRISGAGMSQNATITAVSGNSITINGPAYATSTTVSGVVATALPGYAGFKSGTAAISANNGMVLENCHTGNCKIGVLLNSNFGHVFFRRHYFGGFIGTYTTHQEDDYYFDICSGNPVWAYHMVADYDGMNAKFLRCHLGNSAAYAFYQCSIPAGVGSDMGQYEFEHCMFEDVYEAWFWQLPTSVALRIELNAHMFEGRYGSSQMPVGIEPIPAAYPFRFNGTLWLFRSPTQPNMQIGSLGYAYVGEVNSVGGDMQLDVFGSNITFGNPQGDFAYRDITTLRNARSYLEFSSLTVPESGNFLLDPETAANWAAYYLNPGTTITVTPLSSLTGYTYDYRVLEEYGPLAGINAIVITNPSAVPGATINVLPGSAFDVGRKYGLNFWLAGSGGNVLTDLDLNNNLYLYTVNNPESSVFAPRRGVGQVLTNAGAGTSIVRFKVIGSAIGQTIVLLAPMLSANGLSPYTRWPLPKAQRDVGALVSASTPAANLYDLGTRGFLANGRNNGEAAAAGTGCPVFVKSVGGTKTWCSDWSGVAVTS
jgi:hypothetical protein